MSNKEPGYVYILIRSTSGRLHACKNPCFREDWQNLWSLSRCQVFPINGKVLDEIRKKTY